MVLRLGTPAVPTKGPNSELREDINDKFSQFVDLRKMESQKRVILNGSTYVLGTHSSYPFKKMSSCPRMKLGSGLTSAVLTALW